MRHYRAILAAAAALPLLAAPSAQASPAQVLQRSGCTDHAFFGFTTCFEQRQVLVTQQTPTGNAVAVLNSQATSTITRTATGEELASTTTRDHSASVLVDGTTQVLTAKHTTTSEVGASTCLTTMHVHYADGELRIDEPYETECSWE